MNKEKKTNIKVGITVVFGTLLLIWVLGWAKNFSFSDNYNLVSVKFNSTSGLSEGDIVTVNGVKSGYVESINLVDNFPILLLKVDKSVSLKADATFSIMMLDLMGGKKVEIYPGSEATEINFAETYSGEFVGDIATAMAALSSVENDVIMLVKEIRSAITKINANYLSNEFIGNVNKSLTNLNTLLTQTNKVIQANKGNVSELIKNADSLVQKGSDLLSSNENGIKDNLEDLNELLSNSNNLVKRIDELVIETESKKNNLGKMMYDENMMDELKSTLSSTNKLLIILLEQIKDDGIKVDANIF